MRDVLCIILGGGRGSRLFPLTMHRSKPAVPVAGKYRLIDIPISNCINSGMNQVYVLTQFLSVSLHNHITNTYKFDMFSRGFVEILAAQQTNETADWYQGTADAVRQNLRYISEGKFKDVLILSGDQLYRMNYGRLIERHRGTSADVTIAVLPVAREAVSGLGIMKVDDTGRVTGFAEKPKTAEQTDPFATPQEWIAAQGIQPRGREFLASMGIYAFKREVIIDLLSGGKNATDFGKDIFPAIYPTMQVQTHLFDGFWEDLGTIKSYHETSLALTVENPPFDFNSPEGSIYTRMRNLPPSWIDNARLNQCLVSDGCVIMAGSTLERCIVGVRSRIGRNCHISDTVLIGADRMETDLDRAANARKQTPNLTIGDGVTIHKAILDKDVRIGDGVQIVNKAGVRDAEHANYLIRDGIVAIPRGAVLPPGTII